MDSNLLRYNIVVQYNLRGHGLGTFDGCEQTQLCVLRKDVFVGKR